MDENTLEELLETNTTGVLALADADAAYAIPVSYWYDGDSLVSRLATDGSSTKLDYVDATSEACFVCYAVDPPTDSWSIIRGPLHRLIGSERDAFDDARVNEAFLDLRIFDEEIDEVELAFYELEPRAITGRKTSERVT